MTLAPGVADQARCATPAGRDLVDAAFARTGGPAQRSMEVLCSGCLIWRECLTDALIHGEHGPWGGTNRHRRTQAGAPSSPTFNLTHVNA